MRFRVGMVLALGAGLVLSACAPAAGGAAAGSSPIGKEYPPGTPPRESQFTAPAKLNLAQENYQAALTPSLEGIAEDSTSNPQHYYLAGAAYVGLGNFAAADSMWDVAQEIYPAYELEIEPQREQAWSEAFNEGVTAYNAGNTQGAIDAWTRANIIYPHRAEGQLNLAVLYTQENSYDEAITAYRQGLDALRNPPQTRTLSPEEEVDRSESLRQIRENLAQLLIFTEQFSDAEALYREMLADNPDNLELQSGLASAIARQGRDAEAGEIYNRLLSAPGLSYDDLFNIGVSLFNAQDYARAGEAFRRVTEMTPNSRDAWYNYANALYAAQDFAALVPIAEKLVQVDPLNENSALILARAYRDTEQNEKALAALQAIQDAPIKVEDLQIRAREGQTSVTGTAIGNKAPAGSPVTLRFTFYSQATELGSQTVTVSAPAEGSSTAFEATLVNPTSATGYSYQLVR